MICREPFSCLNIQNEEISACCLMPTWKVDVIDFENDQRLNTIRQSWLNGKWPSECSVCKKSEDKKALSRRLAVNSWFETNKIESDKLTRIDYWCGNICNLRCAICGPDSSVAWQKELGISKKERTTIINHRWAKVDLTNILWIHFNGGEPLLILEHMDLLKSIPTPANVHLNYNTNATVRPTNELIDLWSKFKLVQIDFSIDGIEERFEYMRYPAKWHIVEENLYWFKETMPVNVMFDINATVSILNQDCINSTEQWFATNYYENRLGDPIQFRKQDAFGILAIDNDRTNAINYLNSLDKRRGTNWRKTFPKLIDP